MIYSPIAEVGDQVDFKPHNRPTMIGAIEEVIHDDRQFEPQYIITAHGREYHVAESQVATPD